MSAGTPLTKAQTAHSMGTVIVSAALFVIVLVWLVIVAMNLGRVPIYHSDGTAKLDQYARAKDIFALVLPFLTTVAGFWLGSQGTVQAQRQSRRRHAVARKAQEQRSAILSVAPPMRDGTYLLIAAKAAHPAAWDLPVIPPERSHAEGNIPLECLVDFASFNLDHADYG